MATTNCPHCQDEINAGATVCRHCGAKKGFLSADGRIVDRNTLKKIIFHGWIQVILWGVLGFAFSFILIGIPVLLAVLFRMIPGVIKMQSQLELGSRWYR